MSKLSSIVRDSDRTGRALAGRLILMSVLMVVVLVMLLSLRSGVLRRPPAEPAPTPAPEAPRHEGQSLLGGRLDAAENSIELGDSVLAQAPASTPATEGPQSTESKTPASPLKVPASSEDAPPVRKSPASGDDLFASIADGEIISFEEQPAYNHLIIEARKLGEGPPTEPVLAPGRIELMERPRDFRGRPIRVKGTLLGVNVLHLDPNPDVPDWPAVVYQCTIKSVEEDPYIVLCRENPLKEGSGIREMRGAVVTDARFFKIWAYRVNDRNLTAPLLMAHHLEPIVVKDQLRPVAMIVLGVALALVVVLLIFIRLGTRRGDRLRAQLARETAEESDIPEPREGDRQLSDDWNLP